MNRLEVAHEAGGIESIFWNTLCLVQHPGFQVDPNVSIRDCLEILQQLMRERMGIRQFAFNELHANSGVKSMYSRHIDIPQAVRVNAGIAVHHSVAGPKGTVLLERTPFGIKNIYRSNTGETGPPFMGDLMPGMKTIFSEGMNVENLNLGDVELAGLDEDRLIAVRGIVAVRMGPTVHEFRTNDGSSGLRQWRRYTFNSNHPAVPLDDLLAAKIE